MIEELKQKAKDFIDRINKETDGLWLNKYYLTDLLVMFATENGIQWHDLRKDPNDLPKKNKSYWVYMDCQGNKIYCSIVWQGCWCGWNGVALAWCEEPQFKE